MHILMLILSFDLPDQVPGGGLSLFKPDYMHTKLLGVDANVLGSLIAFLVKEVMPASIEDNVALLWSQIQEYYKEHQPPCRLGRLTYKMVRHDPFPRLAAKAIEVRWLLPAMASVVRAWVGRAEVAHFARLVAQSCRMDEIVFGCKEFRFSVADRAEFQQLCFSFNQVLTRLARHFHQGGLAHCAFTAKNHYLCHMGVDAARTGISPRLGFCFQGEDFLHLVKTLCMGSSRGTSPTQLAEKVVGKYLRGLDLLLSRA